MILSLLRAVRHHHKLVGKLAGGISKQFQCPCAEVYFLASLEVATHHWNFRRQVGEIVAAVGERAVFWVLVVATAVVAEHVAAAIAPCYTQQGWEHE